MNRKNRRHMDKLAKGKLTDKQFSDFKEKTIQQVAAVTADKIIDKTWQKLELFLRESMRENRISEERINKVLDGLIEKSKEFAIKEVTEDGEV